MNNPYSDRVRIRPYQAGDLKQVVDLWNRSLIKDPVTAERFWRSVLLDPNFRAEGALVAECEGRPVGFLQAMVRRVPLGISPIDKCQGWITVFFVDAEFRRAGIGRSLILAGMEFLKDHGCAAVMCNGYAPNYVFPGVDVDYVEAHALMESVGFERATEAVAMELQLGAVLTPPEVENRRSELIGDGVEIRACGESDTLPLLKLAEEQFSYWHQSLIDGLQKERRDILIAVSEDRVFGFAQWENPQTDPPSGARGRFGPFGVHPDMRGKGLGAVIFYTLIEIVAAQGADTLWFGWAGGRNLSFYERAGCQVTRRYQMYRWQRPSGQ